MKQLTMKQRVAELSATLQPIKDLIKGYTQITEEMYGEAEDYCSYNGSFYCNGWIKPVFEGWFKGSCLQKVGEYQVIRQYAVETQMIGIAQDEIPENWEDEGAPDFPDLELQGLNEYKQIWIDREGNTFTNILDSKYSDNEYADDESYIVCADSMNDWAYEPRLADIIRKNVAEKQDSCFGDKTHFLDFFLCPCCEYLMKNEPTFAKLFMAEYEDIPTASRLYKSFKVAHRHGYTFPTDEPTMRMYVDYLTLLLADEDNLANPRYITNPLYVAPKDLRKAHDKLIARKDEIAEKKAMYEAMLKEQAFAEQHSWSFGVEFDNEHFHFKSLDSVEEYRVEGNIMHHCVYRCKYYEKNDVITFHVSDHEGNRVATTSIDVVRQKIIELQTLCNEPTWRMGNEYKEIWNVLCARMHTFPRPHQKNKEQANTLIQIAV